MKHAGWIDYSNPLSRRGGRIGIIFKQRVSANTSHFDLWRFSNVSRVSVRPKALFYAIFWRQVDPQWKYVFSISLSIYSVCSQPVGPLLVSLIFPRWLLWNEQASVVAYVWNRLCQEMTFVNSNLLDHLVKWRIMTGMHLWNPYHMAAPLLSDVWGNTSLEPVASVIRERCRCVSATQRQCDAPGLDEDCCLHSCGHVCLTSLIATDFLNLLHPSLDSENNHQRSHCVAARQREKVTPDTGWKSLAHWPKKERQTFFFLFFLPIPVKNFPHLSLHLVCFTHTPPLPESHPLLHL